MRIAAWAFLLAGLLVATIGITTPDASAQDNTVAVSVGDYTIADPNSGSAFVEVTITPGSSAVGAVEFTLTYDPTVITPTLISNPGNVNDGLPDCTIASPFIGSCGPKNPTGTLRVAVFTLSGQSTELALAQIPFEPVGNSGTTAIDFVVPDPNTGPNQLNISDSASLALPYSLSAGSVTVGTVSTAVPTPTATAQPTSTPTATATTEPTPTPIETPTPGPTSTPTATATPDPSPTPTATATVTSTPEPTSTATPTPTVDPNATSTPVPTATSNPAALADPGPFSLAPSGLEINANEAAWVVPDPVASTAGTGDTAGTGGGDAAAQIGNDDGDSQAASTAEGTGAGLAATGNHPFLPTLTVILFSVGGVFLVASRREQSKSV